MFETIYLEYMGNRPLSDFPWFLSLLLLSEGTREGWQGAI